MEKLRRNQSSVKTGPFQHPVSLSSETHLRQINDQLPQPSHLRTNLRKTSVENPFQDTPFDLQSLESGVAHLNGSSNNRHSLYPSFDGGFLNGSIHDNHVNCCSIGGQGFLPTLEEIEQAYVGQFQNLNMLNSGYNGGFSTSIVPMGSQDSGPNKMMMRSDIDGCGTLVSGSYQASNLNRNGVLRDWRTGDFGNYLSSISSSSQNGFLGGCAGEFPGRVSGLVPRNQNGFKTTLNIRKPRFVDDPLARSGLENWRGNIVALAKDQCGCRFLQKTIDEGSREEIQMIFREVIHHVGDLMLDPFGNYVIQKIVEKGNDNQRMEILMMVTRTDFPLINICLDQHGTRAVQKLLKHLKTREQISSFMSAISPGAVALIMDVHGHHVIQYCLEHFSSEDNKQILNAMAENCYGIAIDQHGCCLMQLCIECTRGEQREHLVNEIIANAQLLSEDCYANYVVQYILGLRVPDFTANLLKHLEGSFASLSRNKYGSHVVEKCLIESAEPQSMQIVMELLTSPEISLLLVDPYGNYVIQCALSVSKDSIFDALVDQVQKNSAMMCSNKYGKKVLARFQDGVNTHGTS